tara:strand:- start:780 stop:1373 length:594 start_codon:yes stop_codon:yes gene_type:complete
MADLEKLGIRPEQGIDPEVQEAYHNVRSSLDRPIPGQSLTNDPNNPYPFEQAPEYTERTEALEYLFKSFIAEDSFKHILTLIRQGIPIMSLTEIFLFKGFSEGKWNPDLMLMLAEPTAYMLMALAERSGIDYIVTKPDDEDMAEADEEQFKIFDKTLKEVSDLKKIDSKLSTSSLPKEIINKLENIPQSESLLAKQE